MIIMKKQIIQENMTDKFGNSLTPCFLGGYISSLCMLDGSVNGITKPYISIDVRSFSNNDAADDFETVRIMVFKKSYGHDNPLIKLIIDAYNKKVPISFVYYSGPLGNTMSNSLYVNFSANTSNLTLTSKEVIDMPF